MSSQTCEARGCGADASVSCIHQGRSHPFCLIHYYASPFAFSKNDATAAASSTSSSSRGGLSADGVGLQVLSTRILKRQKRTTEDVVREMLSEIKQDLLGELERVKVQRKRHEKVASGALHKQLLQEVQAEAQSRSSLSTLLGPSSLSTSVNKTSSSTQASSRFGTDADKLYEWQMKMLKRKQAGGASEEDDPSDDEIEDSETDDEIIDNNGPKRGTQIYLISDEEDNNNSKKMSGSSLQRLASNGSKDKQEKGRVWRPTGEELLGQPHIPAESFRKKAAELLANALLQDTETSRFAAGKVALDVEDCLYLHVNGDQNQYKHQMRGILYNLRVAENKKLRQKLVNETLSPIEFVRMDHSALMDPRSLANLKRSQAEVFEQHRVVSTEEALASKRVVDNAQCPRCENTKGIVMFSLASSRPESTKAEIYGNKEKNDAESKRFRCPSCGHSWTEN